MAPKSYRAAQDDQVDNLDAQDQSNNQDRAQAADNGSSTPPAPKPYQPPQESAVPATQAPTFATLQANNEARPPMPTTPPGQPIPAASGPPSGGIPQFAAPVTGPTTLPDQTATFGYTGSAANLFPGADGKGPTTGGASPGQFWQAFDQSQSAPLAPAEKAKAEAMMRGDPALMDQYKQQYGANWFQQWGADQDKYAERLRNQTAGASDINNLKGKSGTEAWDIISGANNPSGANYMNALRAMTPDQRKSFLDQWPEGSRDRAIMEGSLAAQGITIPNADTGQRWDGKTQNNGPMASAIPVYSQGVQGTGVNGQGLAGYGTPVVGTAAGDTTVPAGVGPSAASVVAPAPFAGTEGATATPNKVATSTAASSGASPTASANGSPSTTASGTDILSQLMAGANGQGAGSQVQNATQQAILDQLKNPNAYNSDAVKSAYNWLGGNIDDQYNLQRQQLGEEMARRGLGASTIYGGRLNDLNIGQRSAKESMAQDLAQQMAKSQQSATGQAISQGLTGGTTAQGNQLDWLSALMGYGQQGFNNDLATAQFNANQNNSWQDFLLKMLSAGYGG